MCSERRFGKTLRPFCNAFPEVALTSRILTRLSRRTRPYSCCSRAVFLCTLDTLKDGQEDKKPKQETNKALRFMQAVAFAPCVCWFYLGAVFFLHHG